ncbi:uncharacterized protein LOC131500765 [Neofelis nebulosa]|uniref:uncharacterized protein LOC131500765 n=1 Tax=Neofelis nebulosa TaxID=61452 RepID=UPI0027297859|nr:uncharacterized protein LOC131500765 [Neofelis nebulosa]
MAPRGAPLAGLGRAAEQAPPRTQAGPGLSHRLRASRIDCITSARARDSSPAEGPEDSPSGLKGWVRSWAREWRRNSAARAGAEVGASLRAPPWRHFRGAQLEFAASTAAKGALWIGVAGQPRGGRQGRGRGASRPRTGELLGARRRRPYNRRRLLKIKTSASRHSDQTTAAAGGRQKPCHRRLWGRFGGTPRVPAGAGLRPQPHGPRPPPPPKKLAEIEPGARLPRMRRRDTTDLTKRSATWKRSLKQLRARSHLASILCVKTHGKGHSAACRLDCVVREPPATCGRRRVNRGCFARRYARHAGPPWPRGLREQAKGVTFLIANVSISSMLRR